MIEENAFDGFTVHGTVVPKHARAGLLRYINYGTRTGSFLQAVFENNLKEAIARADIDCMENLPAIMGFLYQYAPSACWGSPEAYKTWKGVSKL